MDKFYKVNNTMIQEPPKQKQTRVTFFGGGGGKETFHNSKIFRGTNLSIAYKRKYAMNQILNKNPLEGTKDRFF
jgi:hypothetical protein